VSYDRPRMADAPVLVAILAVAGAVAAGATALTRPYVAVAILFVLASTSRVTLDTPVGTMRLEQPAIAVVAAVLLAAGRFRILRRPPRAILAIGLAFGTYLGVLALSSAVIAPEPASSLRLVAWLAISMVGGIVAFVLIQPRPVGAILPLAFGGAAKGAVGVAVAALYLVAGPAFDLGIQESNGILPRVDGFTWEANLYASFLAMCVPFALEAARGSRRTIGLVMLVLVVVGLPLGQTRGAYIGAIAGVAAYAVVRLARERRRSDLPALTALATATFVVGLVAANILLPNAVERYAADARSKPSPGPGTSFGTPSFGEPPGSGGPSISVSPRPSPVPSLAPYPDTVTFRLDRVPIAIGDLPQSPLVGFGAESFGQRHRDPSQQGLPDHLAILAVAAVYDAGILGALALAIGFILILFRLWQAAGTASRAGDGPTVGAAAAFIGSLVAMLVSYQATNALHFAINWIVIGAAAALVARVPTLVATAAREP
jgi:hypothetical protein